MVGLAYLGTFSGLAPGLGEAYGGGFFDDVALTTDAAPNPDATVLFPFFSCQAPILKQDMFLDCC